MAKCSRFKRYQSLYGKVLTKKKKLIDQVKLIKRENMNRRHLKRTQNLLLKALLEK